MGSFNRRGKCRSGVVRSRAQVISGTCLAVYPCGPLSASARRAFDLARPKYAMPHQGPDGLAAHAPTMAKEIEAELLIGVGCDVWTDRAIHKVCTVQKAVDELCIGADIAASLNAVAVVYDPELTDFSS